MAGDPNQIATDWANRLGQSSDKITRGIQAVNVAPGQAAARQKEVYAANVQQAKDKWARKVAAVSLGDWQQASIGKGVPRIAQGAAAAQPKFAAFMGKLLPHIAAGQAALPARGGLDANINRAVAFMRHMSNFKS